MSSVTSTAQPGVKASTPEFIVASSIMRKFIAMVERVACHVGTVLIIGETGSGKEHIARLVHEHSTRSDKPFVEINCAALPETLVESELFGYEKGAFSGAESDKAGLFELAHQGTIFLDEIGELDLKVQGKLLRVLDRAPYYRLGGNRKVTSDVRVVAATNRNLKEEVNEGRFRKDLYHRLSQFELCVPPLRERLEDIPVLALHFLKRVNPELNFSPEALSLLESYQWPGNIRELQNVVNKVAVLTSGAEIGTPEIRQELDHLRERQEKTTEVTIPLEDIEAQRIRTALDNSGGHRGRAAQQLGISRRTLSRRLREYGFASARRRSKPVLGSVSYEEQQSFRAEISVPVVVVTPLGESLNCTSTNLSAGGMGLLGLTKDLPIDSRLVVQFHLPDSKTALSVPARVAWNGVNGRAGITFVDVTPEGQLGIRNWVKAEMRQEGWFVPEEKNASQPEPSKIQ